MCVRTVADIGQWIRKTTPMIIMHWCIARVCVVRCGTNAATIQQSILYHQGIGIVPPVQHRERMAQHYQRVSPSNLDAREYHQFRYVIQRLDNGGRDGLRNWR